MNGLCMLLSRICYNPVDLLCFIETPELIKFSFGRYTILRLSYVVMEGDSGTTKKLYFPLELCPEVSRRCTIVRRQFITPSVLVCVQHYGRDAVNRAGSSAETEPRLTSSDLMI